MFEKVQQTEGYRKVLSKKRRHKFFWFQKNSKKGFMKVLSKIVNAKKVFYKVWQKFWKSVNKFLWKKSVQKVFPKCRKSV